MLAHAPTGDGLVAARHLWQFGYKPICLYPKPTSRQLFINLVEQCRQLDIEFLDAWPGKEGLGESEVAQRYGTLREAWRKQKVYTPPRVRMELPLWPSNQSDRDLKYHVSLPRVHPKPINERRAPAGEYDVVLDAMFGFGFKGDPRPPFDTIIRDLSQGGTPVVSVDVPSGWSVSFLRLTRAHFCAEGEPRIIPGTVDLTVINEYRFTMRDWLTSRLLPWNYARTIFFLPSYGGMHVIGTTGRRG